MQETNNNQSNSPSILERVQSTNVTTTDTFEPTFSPGLQDSSSKLSITIKKTTATYKNEGTKFGGKPFPWD